MKHVFYLMIMVTTLLGAFTSKSEAQSSWEHIYLRSSQGYQVQVDYQKRTAIPGGGEQFTQATPVWINVTKIDTSTWPGGLSIKNVITAVLTTYTRSSNYPVFSQRIGLGDAGAGRFTGLVPQPLQLAYVNESGDQGYYTKLSFEVDGACSLTPDILWTRKVHRS